MIRKVLVSALFGCALLAAPGPAAAQATQPITGTISALALQPVSPGGTIEIVSYDDSDLAQAIAGVAAQAASARGYQVGAGGQFQLGIELIDHMTINDRSPTLGSAGYDSAGQDDTNVRVNIFADSEDSVLGGRVGPGSADVLEFGLYVTLNDRSTGRRVWQAEIMADISGSSRETAGRLMTQAVIQRLGEPIAQEQVILE